METEQKQDITPETKKDINDIAPVTEEMVLEALKECYDPEIPVNVVDLGLIYEILIDNEKPGHANVYIKMTLTAAGCAMGPMIASDVQGRLLEVAGVENAFVELVFHPLWTPKRMSESAKLILGIQD